jgi:hypothetical protein
MKWFCRSLGIVGVTVEQESAQPHLPHLSLSLSLLLSFSHFSFTLHNLQQSYQQSLGNWDNSHFTAESSKLGGFYWLLCHENEWIHEAQSLSIFFGGGGVNFVFCCTTIL